jgi:hypothetical protein
MMFDKNGKRNPDGPTSLAFAQFTVANTLSSKPIPQSTIYSLALPLLEEVRAST